MFNIQLNCPDALPLHPIEYTDQNDRYLTIPDGKAEFQAVEHIIESHVFMVLAWKMYC